MPCETEGRISLALQAYISNQIPSLRATANTYDVLFETLRERHLGVPSRKETTPNSRKFTNNEEQVLFRKILQLSADGFPPQRAIVGKMANTTLQTKNPSRPIAGVGSDGKPNSCCAPTRAVLPHALRISLSRTRRAKISPYDFDPPTSVANAGNFPKLGDPPLIDGLLMPLVNAGLPITR